jgi:hypothetical protein
LPGEQDKGVVVVATMEEVAPAVLDVLQGLTHVWELFEIQDIRGLEAQEIAIKMHCLVDVGDVEAKVAETANFEGLSQHHATDVIALLRGRHSASFRGEVPL